LRELSGAFEAEGSAAPCGRSALLVGAPGDQHTFGVFVLQEFFRRAGWDVHGGALGSSDELLNLVAGQGFDVIGLSVSNSVDLGDLASLVRTVREAARPHAPLIMVGGRFFLECPQCIGEVGADATAQDGRRAILRVASLLPPNVLG
jgi:methylmalonyl-CoA mutase cobalamin-binding subunit